MRGPSRGARSPAPRPPPSSGAASGSGRTGRPRARTTVARRRDHDRRRRRRGPRCGPGEHRRRECSGTRAPATSAAAARKPMRHSLARARRHRGAEGRRAAGRRRTTTQTDRGVHGEDLGARRERVAVGEERDLRRLARQQPEAGDRARDEEHPAVGGEPRDGDATPRRRPPSRPSPGADWSWGGRRDCRPVARRRTATRGPSRR